MTTPAEDPFDTDNAPNWSFSPDHDVRCPECNTHLRGLNWVLDGEGDAAHTVGMRLIPCGHELPTDQWELNFAGRPSGGERRYGQNIKKPGFVRKTGE